jgi:pimeloyl-ACP methyl ester carboxylesterase
MSRWVNISLIVLLAFAFLPSTPVHAQANPECDFSGTQSTSALYCITLPHGEPNGGLVIFAHGYVSVREPLAIPWSQMTFVSESGNTIYLPDIINDLGFTFATTSYSVNGLAVNEGIADILDLIRVVTETFQAPPAFVLLVGASEGGLITTLAVERYPEYFSGGLATCGPIGSFTGQVNYWGDFRVLFDYFMDLPRRDVLPGSAIEIPEDLMVNWETVYMPRVLAYLIFRPLATRQLLAVSAAPYDLADRTTIAETSLGILWYNVFATNDAVAKLGGNPFDNHDRKYTGSYSDYWLNRRVARFTADPAALANIASFYETSGILQRPLVTMHTTGDPIVPGWHQSLYAQKVLANNPAASFIPNEIDRYGHCAFTLDEVQEGFGQLIYLVTGQAPPVMPQLREFAEPEQVEEVYYYDYH